MNNNFNHLGIPSSHTWYELGCILEIIERHGVNLFIELGFLHGGLGSMLGARTMLVDSFHYFGVELRPQGVHPNFIKLANLLPKVGIKFGDVFSSEVQEMIGAKTISRNGCALIYCDNGNKPREFNDYSLRLKRGDLIMVHDYPNEFNDEHIATANKKLSRIEMNFLKKTRLVLFRHG